MLEFQSRNAGYFTRTMRRVASRSVISRSHSLYRQHHVVRELFTCVEYQDLCEWDFNGDLEFDEVPGTTAVEEVEREEDDQEATYTASYSFFAILASLFWRSEK